MAGTTADATLRVDPRLPAYAAVGLGGLVLAVVLGRPELAAVAAPFALLALLGVADRRDPVVRADVRLAADRVLEGDEVTGEVRIGWQGTAEVMAVLHPLPGVDPIDPAPATGWIVPTGAHPPSAPASLAFTVRARAWGRHQLGLLHVRARRPWGLLVWESVPAGGPDLRILPGGGAVDQLLEPHEARTVAGAHLSDQRGAGTEFAELRPYVAGDRLRDISWAASARLGEPWVVVHHPERAGTVLLLLDTFTDGSDAGLEALARAARAAWAVASQHLSAGDRVGLLGSGPSPAWLSPAGGRRARYELLDELLAVGATAEDRRRRRRTGRRLVPPDALVVGISALRSPGFTGEALHHRRVGRTVAVVVIDTSDLVPAPTDRTGAAAHRLWQAEVDVARHDLARRGVPSAVVGPGGGVDPVVRVLRRATRRRAAASR